MATLNLISTSFFRFSSFQYFIFKTLSTTFEDNLLLYMRSKGKTIFLQYFSIAAFTFVRSILSIRNVIEAHKTNMSHICFHCCRRFYIFFVLGLISIMSLLAYNIRFFVSFIAYKLHFMHYLMICCCFRCFVSISTHLVCGIVAYRIIIFFCLFG